MNIFITFLMIGIAILAVLPFIYIPDFNEEKCPFCYGKSFCNRKNITLRMSSLADFVNNYFSVKNVYFTTENVVLKKLGHKGNLNLLDQEICNLHNVQNCNIGSLNRSYLNFNTLLRQALQSTDKGYRICGNGSVDLILKRLLKGKDNIINLWTISMLSFEGLFYKVFDAELFSLPVYYGACGRIIAVENCGKPLNEFENYSWIVRASIGRSIIGLFLKFTEGDHDFRIYFTDISPDNIVVDENTLVAKFIDLENVILTKKTNYTDVHASEDFRNDHGFVYFENSICRSSISDHNIYSICKLIFAHNAPWPMMEGGLLHTIPKEIQSKYQQLHKLIDACIQPLENIDRFESIRMVDDQLKDILSVYPIV